MATYYGVKGSSNWNSGAWSTVSAKDATRTGSGVTPTAADDCILDDWTSDGGGSVWTVNATTCVCKSLNCAGYAGTLAFGANRLGVSGSVTFAAGQGITSAGTSGELRLNASGTITMAGLIFPGRVVLAVSATYTLAGSLDITGILSIAAGTCIFSGPYDVSCGDLIIYGSCFLVLPAGRRLNVSNSITLAGVASTTVGFIATGLRSDTASSKIYLAYTGASNGLNVAGGAFTDVDFSTYSAPLKNLVTWYGAITRTAGITVGTNGMIGGLLLNPGLSGGLR